MVWYRDFIWNCEHCKSAFYDSESRTIAKIDSNGDAKFFKVCPTCESTLCEINPDSLFEAEKQRLIREAKYRKYETLYALGFLIIFYLIACLIWYYSPQLLIGIGIFIFAFFTMLNPL